jgi:tRNA pseudouridine38-40 synthase
MVRWELEVGSRELNRTVKLTVSYDGTRFVGWQRQAAGESIQGLLEEALARFEGAPVTVHGAGRTDAGVHALGQVASVQLTCTHPADALLRGLNAFLPPEVRVNAVEDAPPGFHARFSARSKTYRYVICTAPIVSPFERAYVWHVPEPLDVAAMQAAAAALVGTFDFAAFGSAGSQTRDTARRSGNQRRRAVSSDQRWHERDTDAPDVPGSRNNVGRVPIMTRTITRSVVECRDADGTVAYEVTGTGFLRHMVRAIVGTLVEIGRGWRPPSSMASLVAARARADAGATAPAHGLFLVRVDYH